MKSVLLLSAQAGAGRSLLAANLAPLLAEASGLPVSILEACPASESEIALHRGELPSGLAAIEGSLAGVGHACVDSLGALQSALDVLESRDAWVLVDGASLDQADWQAWAQRCGRLLLVERGDLSGCRRMLRLLQACKHAHWPWASLQTVWMGEQGAQPLPALPEKPAVSVPWYAKATERLAAASLPALDDPKSAFSQALRRLLPALMGLQALPRDAALGASAPASPQASDEEQALVERLRQGLRAQLNLAAAEAQGLGGQDFKAQWEPRVRSATDVTPKTEPLKNVICELLGQLPVVGFRPAT